MNTGSSLSNDACASQCPPRSPRPPLYRIEGVVVYALRRNGGYSGDERREAQGVACNAMSQAVLTPRHTSPLLASGAPTGATLLKRRHLELLGHALVSVPYWEWDRCKEAREREQYLKSKLAAGPLLHKATRRGTGEKAHAGRVRGWRPHETLKLASYRVVK